MPSVAQDAIEAGEPNLGGRPEIIRVDGEDAMNAISLLDDAAKALVRTKLEAVARYDDIIRKAVRLDNSTDLIRCAKRSRFDAIARYDDAIKKALNAKKSLVQSIAKYNGEMTERVA